MGFLKLVFPVESKFQLDHLLGGLNKSYVSGADRTLAVFFGWLGAAGASPLRGLSRKKFTRLSIYLLISKPFHGLNPFEHFKLLFKLPKNISQLYLVNSYKRLKRKSEVTDYWDALTCACWEGSFIPLLSCSQVCVWQTLIKSPLYLCCCSHKSQGQSPWQCNQHSSIVGKCLGARTLHFFCQLHSRSSLPLKASCTNPFHLHFLFNYLNIKKSRPRRWNVTQKTILCRCWFLIEFSPTE